MSNYECYCKPTENIVENFSGYGGGGHGGGWRGGNGGAWRGGNGGAWRGGNGGAWRGGHGGAWRGGHGGAWRGGHGGAWRGRGRYRDPFYAGNGYYNFYPPADEWAIVPYNNMCGCQTSTIPNPEIINGSIRGGVNNVYQCEPGSDETCYCRDTCNGNPDMTSNSNWWN